MEKSTLFLVITLFSIDIYGMQSKKGFICMYPKEHVKACKPIMRLNSIEEVPESVEELEELKKTLKAEYKVKKLLLDKNNQQEQTRLIQELQILQQKISNIRLQIDENGCK